MVEPWVNFGAEAGVAEADMAARFQIFAGESRGSWLQPRARNKRL